MHQLSSSQTRVGYPARIVAASNAGGAGLHVVGDNDDNHDVDWLASPGAST